ncbi:error-prone DNA polymerase [Lacunimicrobium album]
MQYTELHCLSNFSFLQAASHPEELVEQAHDLGYNGIAITDRHSVSGVVRAHTKAKELSSSLIIGAEISPEDAPQIVLWAKNRDGYGELCHLITKGRTAAAKGSSRLTMEDVACHTAGLMAGILPPIDREEIDVKALHGYRELFGNDVYLMAQLFRGARDRQRLDWLRALSRKSRIPLVASGNVLFHTPSRRMLYDVVTAIRHHTTVEQAIELLPPNRERYLRPLNDLAKLYAGHLDLIERTQDIASQCTFSLNELRYEYPEELVPSGYTPSSYLRELTWGGAKGRFPDGIPDKIRSTIEHELNLVEDLHYEPYFLTVWDLVRFARSKNILCQGRGSAANSTVCYCLGVTSVDPSRIDVLFERFISRERDEAPDIDIDFEHERREEVLQYLYDKYGRERAGMTAVTTTYRPKSAIRDVGKALGLSLDLVDRLAKNADHYRAETDFADRCREAGLNAESDIGKRFLYLTSELIDFPRHLSQHTGGMVMSRGPLHRLVPIENASMPGRTVVQWNKDDLDDLGILKVDCLALGMLTAIRKCFDMVEKHHGQTLTLASVPEDDPIVYDMICRADTIGVFQIESRAQMSMLPRLRPRKYYDLVIEVSIVRPGPIQGDMVHPYLRRRTGVEEVTYPTPAVEAVLKKTLGVPLFQEQCMQIAMVAAGFTPGEADQLRRAMGAWRKTGVMEKFRLKLLEGMAANGIEGKFAEQVFTQIAGFASYGFPESHAASFALLVYVSSWLKCYYPAIFAAGIINSQPMGFYAPAQLIKDAQNHGVDVLPVDVNHSEWDCTIENGAVRLGYRMIAGMQQEIAHTITEFRQQKCFDSFDDFLSRTRLSRAHLMKLADADAFGSLSHSRRPSLWEVLGQDDEPEVRGLFQPHHYADLSSPVLPAMSPEEEVFADYRTTSLSLKAHPMSFHRVYLSALGVTANGDLIQDNHGKTVTAAGIVLLRQRPGTAKGITFVTIEDETGTANLIVHQQTWERFRLIARSAGAWLVHGELQAAHGVIHVIVKQLKDLSHVIRNVRMKSRHFR